MGKSRATNRRRKNPAAKIPLGKKIPAHIPVGTPPWDKSRGKNPVGRVPRGFFQNSFSEILGELPADIRCTLSRVFGFTFYLVGEWSSSILAGSRGTLGKCVGVQLDKWGFPWDFSRGRRIFPQEVPSFPGEVSLFPWAAGNSRSQVTWEFPSPVRFPAGCPNMFQLVSIVDAADRYSLGCFVCWRQRHRC